MFSQALAAILVPFLLTPTILASPITHSPRKLLDTAEIYYLTNCFNNSNTNQQWAEVDYYKDSSFSSKLQAPDKIGIFNPKESIDYEDGTWEVDTPFKFKAFVEDGAYTSAAGSVVGNANSSTYAGPMNVVRLKRVVLYNPSPDVDCYTDYAAVDSQED